MTVTELFEGTILKLHLAADCVHKQVQEAKKYPTEDTGVILAGAVVVFENLRTVVNSIESTLHNDWMAANYHKLCRGEKLADGVFIGDVQRWAERNGKPDPVRKPIKSSARGAVPQPTADIGGAR
jgi:hypothetical protein